MNMIDACVLVMLAIGDIALIIHLRRRHHRAVCTERMMRSLEFAIRREIAHPISAVGERQLLRVG